MIRSRHAAPLVAGEERRAFRPTNAHARSCVSTPLAVSVLAVLLTAAGAASADDETGVLQARHKTYESPQNFAFEIRVGQYHPRVDTDPSLKGKGPYQAIFGDSDRWEFAVEFDYQAYRIPHLGTIGPGASIGYTSSSALAPLVTPVDGSRISGETTSLTIYPMYLVAVLRIDVLSRELKVPLVPYLKGGLGVGLWEASNSAGPSCYAATKNAPCVLGEGHTVGTQLAAGMALDLNFLDRRTSQGFDNATGVNHTFIFGELQDYNLNGIFQKNALDIGNHNWTVGLGFEF
jgi:hypothetical protein